MKTRIARRSITCDIENQNGVKDDGSETAKDDLKVPPSFIKFIKKSFLYSEVKVSVLLLTSRMTRELLMQNERSCIEQRGAIQILSLCI